LDNAKKAQTADSEASTAAKLLYEGGALGTDKQTIPFGKGDALGLWHNDNVTMSFTAS
jgi:hypothetical protein